VSTAQAPRARSRWWQCLRKVKSGMKNYLARFAMMVEELKRCGDVVALLNYNLFEPVPDASLAEVEDVLGMPLGESIKDFFKLTNGLQLRWILKSSPAFDPEKHRFTPEPFDWLLPWDDYLPDTGLVNVLPLEEIFLRDWKGFVWFGSEAKRRNRFLGVEYNGLSFKKSIKPFDAFNKFYSMAFFVGDRQSDPKVILGEDHLADFASSRVTNFESYLEFLLATKGIVAERKNFYSDSFNSSAEPKEVLITRADDWQGDRVIKVC
jgi:hypothetical protein